MWSGGDQLWPLSVQHLRVDKKLEVCSKSEL